MRKTHEPCSIHDEIALRLWSVRDSCRDDDIRMYGMTTNHLSPVLSFARPGNLPHATTRIRPLPDQPSRGPPALSILIFLSSNFLPAATRPSPRENERSDGESA